MRLSYKKEKHRLRTKPKEVLFHVYVFIVARRLVVSQAYMVKTLSIPPGVFEV